MNLTDKLYNEWAWRTKSGVPSFDNPEDVKILENLIVSLGVIKEEQEPESITKQDIIAFIDSANLDDKQIKKLYNRVRNFTNYRAVKNTVINKGFHQNIQKQYSKEIQDLLEDLPDADNKKLVTYLENESKQINFPSEARSDNLFSTIEKTGLPKNVVTALAKHTAQDEGKKGVGMGEIALAFLFKNIDSAGKGDLTLNKKEFEIKGYNARLGNTKETQGSYIIKELSPGFGPYFDAVKNRKGSGGGFPAALANYIKENSDVEKEVKNTLTVALRNAHGAPSVDELFNTIKWTDSESINYALQQMHFHSYAMREGFNYFLAHDFGAGGKNLGNYIMVAGDASEMAKQLLPYMKNGKVNFERIRANQLGPRIKVR